MTNWRSASKFCIENKIFYNALLKHIFACFYYRVFYFTDTELKWHIGYYHMFMFLWVIWRDSSLPSSIFAWFLKVAISDWKGFTWATVWNYSLFSNAVPIVHWFTFMTNVYKLSSQQDNASVFIICLLLFLHNIGFFKKLIVKCSVLSLVYSKNRVKRKQESLWGIWVTSLRKRTGFVFIHHGFSSIPQACTFRVTEKK